jgi:integrase/recombinase XerD
VSGIRQALAIESVFPARLTRCPGRIMANAVTQFAEKRLAKAPSRLTLEDLQAPFLGVFLDNLECTRANGARSRNLRLTAIRSFFRYIALEAPQYAGLIQRVLAISNKRHPRPLVGFLTRPEIDALLAAPDRDTWLGRRNHALLLTAIQTGLRLSEITSIRQLESFSVGEYIFDVKAKDARNDVLHWPSC